MDALLVYDFFNFLKMSQRTPTITMRDKNNRLFDVPIIEIRITFPPIENLSLKQLSLSMP
jgi:hypothetical protein